jgi:serine/threonine-protein kinase HipA
MSHFDTVHVYADLERFRQPALMGELHCQQSRSGEIFSFNYDGKWLAGAETFAFDPDLALVAGHQYPASDRAHFGIFLDSSPDRWGRVLMQRRENSRARREKRRARTLTEWDFLLGVHDETRLGALRFRVPPDGPFIDADAHLAAPPITSLRELQAASLHFEEHLNEEQHPEYERWLTQLFAPGTSLGGARPKASVRDEQGIDAEQVQACYRTGHGLRAFPFHIMQPNLEMVNRRLVDFRCRTLQQLHNQSLGTRSYRPEARTARVRATD